MSFSTRTNRRRLMTSPLGTVLPLEDRVTPVVGLALSNNSLIRFDTDNPAAALAPVPVTGLTAGENLVGIDVRPQNGQLYGLASNGAGAVRLYAVSDRSGVATPLSAAAVTFDDGAGNPVLIPGTSFGIDFNPTVDRLRVVTDGGFNFRINPNTGALVDGDGIALGVNPDGAVNGGTTTVDGAAYTNNSPNAAFTTLYTIDAVTKSIHIQNPPNAGTQTTALPVTVGGNPLTFTAAGGFDIPAGVNVAAPNAAATGTAFGLLTVGGSAKVYGIDLATGAATALGLVGNGTAPVQGFAVQSAQAGTPMISLSADGLTLSRFLSNAPATAVTKTVTGITVGETLVGIDFRPATGQLIGFGVADAADKGTLYVIDPQSAAATVIGTAGGIAFVDALGAAVDLPSGGYGIDFNPTVDRIRVTNASGLNLRLNPLTGAGVDGDSVAAGVNPDGNINGLGVTGASAVAYTNNFAQQTLAAANKITTLYALEAGTGKLAIIGIPNAGTVTATLPVTLAGAPLAFDAVNGFDIPAGVSVTASNQPAAGLGYATLTVAGTTQLYSIDLATGAAAVVGPVGAGLVGLAGLTAADAPAGSVGFSAATFTIGEAGGTLNVTLTRTGGSSGAVTATLAVAGTATAGTDFTAPPTTVTFADGVTTATVAIPVTNDTLFETNETIVLTLSAPTNAAALGQFATTTATITDDDTAPTLSVADVAAAEGNAGTTPFVFTVTLSAASGVPVTVTVNATPGTATTPADYAATAQTLTFAPGVTTQTFTVNVAGDTVVEPDETFVVVLSAPAGATIADGIAVGTITNDDAGPNTPPQITDIPNATTTTGTAAGPFTFGIGDAETGTASLVVAATSNDQTLLPNANIVITGTGPARQITVTPAAGQVGVATVTVTVTDPAGAVATDTFTLTVAAAPTTTPPTISDTPDQATTSGQALGPIAVTVGDAETAANLLTLTAVSTNTTLVPAGAIAFGGTGANRTVFVTPAAGQVGTATITFTVTDGAGQTATDSFVLTVTAVPANTAPAVSDVMNQASTGAAVGPVAFTVADAEDGANNLAVVGTSSNATLVPAANIVITGTGPNRLVTVTPVAGQVGSAVITLTATDAGGLTGTDTFTVTVGPATGNNAPTISTIANQATTTGTGTAPVAFTVNDVETTAANLTVTASSSNAALVPAANVGIGGTGTNRTVTVSPAAGQVGTATITLTVTDAGGLTATRTFNVVVTAAVPANAPPTVSDVPNQTTTAGTAIPPVAFTVGDAEDGPNNLTPVATTSNAALVPAANVVITGTGATRTASITPVAGVTGTATITLTVTDSAGRTGTDTFIVTVNPTTGTTGTPILVGYPQFAAGANGAVNFYGPTGAVLFTNTPFPGFTGDVRTAAGDFNGDGTADVVVGTGPGRSTRVRVLDGKTQAELFSVDPFESSFTGGVYVAAGDVDGDGKADLVITPDEGGGPRADVYSNRTGAFTKTTSFFGIDDVNFRGGARAAVGDVNGDGRGDLIVVAGFGGGPRVAGYDGKSLGGTPVKIFADFFAFEQTLRNGVFVAAGDLDGDGFAELIAGGGPGGGPRVLAFAGKALTNGGLQTPVTNFFAGNPDNRGGVRVSVKNLDGDARADIVVGSGTGAGARVTGYLGKNVTANSGGTPSLDFDAFTGATNGVFVG